MGDEADESASGILLEEILGTLDLKYDASVGLLDGELLRQIPPVSTLLKVEKLLTSLSKELKDTEKADENLLKLVQKALGEPDDDDSNSKKRKASQAFGDEKSNDEDEEGDEDEDDNEDDETENKDNSAKGEPSKAESGRSEVEGTKAGTAEFNGEDEDEDEAVDKDDDDDDDDDDEDDVSLAKRKRSTPLTKRIKIEDEQETATPDEGNNEELSLLQQKLNSKDDPVPPVQSGSFTQRNDTRLKNPKSEYVEPQTLSKEAIAELGLFSADNNGLETQGTDYKKKVYGVASYPERDLLDMLPGPIPNVDFSKNKPPSNQVQFTTFQSYIESYFRPFLDEDIKFLKEENIVPPGVEKSYDPDTTPYIIPKLGQFYADVWTEEDANLGAKLNTPAFQQPSLDSYKAKGDIENLYDDKLYSDEISCGPLSTRLLLAILSNHEGKYFEEGDLDDDDKLESTMDDNVATQLELDDNYKFSVGSNDFYSLEERLKRELKYIGIFMNVSNNADKDKNRKAKVGNSIVDNDDWIKNKEDDEVCAEIRELQQELREAVVRNRHNRKMLVPVVEEQIAYQEYSNILDDLDKQVDQAYVKRLKSKNKKKKVETVTAQQHAANVGLRALLEKRKKWISNIGGIFRAPEIMKREPSTLILSVKESSEGGDEKSSSDEVKVEEEEH